MGLQQRRLSCSILLCILLHVSLSCIGQVAAVKRTMPMIGMEEEEEGERPDDEATSPAAAETPQSSRSFRSMINSFLSGAVTTSVPFQATSPVEREYARQVKYPSGEIDRHMPHMVLSIPASCTF